MALPPLAEVVDLERRLGRTFDDDVELAEVESALDEASAIIRTEAGHSFVSPDDPSVSTAPTIVRQVCIRMVERKIRNPDGYSSESAGDYSYQRNGVGADGGLYLTDTELRWIRKAGGNQGIWTMPVTRDDRYWEHVFAEDSFGCELFPIGNLGVYPFYDC
jgi:Phage protein Gp19/Gp15/Gp42